MALGAPRPRFDPDLALTLREDLEDRLAAVAEALSEPLWVSKRDLAQVHACEGHHQAEKEERFAWSARTAEGTVVHRALQLSMSARPEVPALALVDRALDSLRADETRTSLAPWLAGVDELELAEVRARAAHTVVSFRECWPPLRPAWQPRTEAPIGAEVCDGRIILRGRPDLVLGVARGDEARSLIVDLKTGRPRSSHADDLRFYALVQTLRVGVPPFRVASYYLDTATFQAEDVDAEVLAIAVGRTVDGVMRLVRLQAGEPPRLAPGPTCAWCRARATCPAAEKAGAVDDVEP